MRAILILSLIALLLVAGCVQPPKTELPSSQNETVAPQVQKPTFEILSPSQNETVFIDANGTASVDVALSAANLLVKPAGSAAKEGEGHFHVYVDSKNQRMLYSKRFQVDGLTLGYHIITIEFVNNDHGSYIPRITRSVIVRVEREVQPPKTYDVKINDFAYDPEVLEIKIGDAVSWKNTGSYPRTVTSKDNFDSGIISPGQTYSRQFNDAGEYRYQSSNYALEKGKIIVMEG